MSIGGAGLYVNRLNASVIDSALFNNSVMILAATPAQLGLPAGTTNFKWKIQTCPGFAPLCGPLNGFFYDEAAGPFSWNYAAASQGLNFAGKHLAQDLNGASLPVTWNLANIAANGSLGALLLHHHNAAGSRAEVVVVEGTQSADLAIAKSMAPPNPTIGQNVVFTITVTNAGPGRGHRCGRQRRPSRRHHLRLRRRRRRLQLGDRPVDRRLGGGRRQRHPPHHRHHPDD